MNADELDLLDDLLREAGIDRSNAAPAIERLRAREAPASFQQRRLWFLHELEPSSAAYNIATALRLRGPIVREALQEAFDRLVARHEILRTSFENRDGEPWQRIAPPAPVAIAWEQLADRDLDALIRDESRTRFDLTRGPLFRVRILSTAADEHVLLLTLHHIIADGWSLGIFGSELMAYYRGASLPELRIQYADYAAWQRAVVSFDEQYDYWREQLRDLPSLDLPTDFRRPKVQTFNGDVLAFEVPATLARSLKDVARGEATPFMVLLTAFAVLLSRYARQHDIVLGTSVAHREQPDTQSLIGFFVNMLVLRIDASGDPTFRELLARVQRVMLDGFDHADIPYETLVERLQPVRDPSRNPLYQVAFTMLNAPRPDVEMGDLRIETLATQRAARFDLELFMDETPSGFGGMFSYNTDLFACETIQRLARHFHRLLSSIAASPDMPVSRLVLLDEEETRSLVRPPVAEFRSEDTIDGRFACAAQRFPDRTALRFENRSISYRELDQRSDAVARRLADAGIGPGDLAGLWADRSLELVIAIIGILKAGGAYVPLDPAYPQERVAYMLEDSGVAAVVTTAAVASLLPSTAAKSVVIDDLERTSEPFAARGAADDPAYVIYTSGSTGRPKGVVVTHRNVVRLMDATQPWYRFNEEDVWTLFHSHAFDFSVWEMWGALFYGGTLIVVPHLVSRSPEEFYNLLCDERVTVLNQTPSSFRQLIGAEIAIARESEIALRFVIFGGEALDLAMLEPWMDRHGDESPKLINMYGITETTVHVTYRPIAWRDVKQRLGSVVGIPIPDLQTLLLDENLAPVPEGAIGEIFVGGAGVARGYLHRPELTAERMIANPFGPGRLYRTGDLARRLPGGELEFQRRADDQVKIRGFRIELQEIEAVLAEVSGVAEVVAAVREDEPGDQRLVAYVVPRAGAGVDASRWVSQWAQAFDDAYSNAGAADPAFDITGWTSGVTGEPIPAAEMREWLDDTVAGIRALHPNRVLEIGCGTGMLLHRIAPDVESYTGTDISATVLARLPQWPNVRLLQRDARDFTELGGTFDTIIINSVVQYFPGIDYFLDVLDGAFGVLADGGSLFLGDVRNLRLLDILQSRRPRGTHEEELLLDPAIFAALRSRHPRIEHVDVQLKPGSARNELTAFRYDVVLRTAAPPAAAIAWAEWSGDPARIEAIAGTGVRNVPNARIGGDVDPAELVRQAREAGCDLTMSWVPNAQDGRFDVCFHAQGTRPHMRIAELSPQHRDWAAYANDVARGRLLAALVPQLRRRAAERLPDYMIPSAFVLLDRLPLTPSGKRNRAALPPPPASRATHDSAYAAPRTPLERGLSLIWSEVLGLDAAGVDDDFFVHGGHSLLATQLVSRIRQALQIELPLRAVFSHPTPAALAREIERLVPVVQDALVPVPRTGVMQMSFA
ncbi:MAG: amino acid adenylation domain-containing protein, partial [Acidobacteriota bacterium]